MATLTADQIEELESQGFLLVKGALDPELDIDPVRDEFAAILDRLANRLRAEGKIGETLRRPAVRGPDHRRRGGIPGADHRQLRDRPAQRRHHRRDADQLRPGHVQLPAQPAHSRSARAADRRRDLLQPGPAHAHQAAAVRALGKPLGQPDRRDPMAPGPGRRPRRGRPHADHHGLGGDDRRRRDERLSHLRTAQPPRGPRVPLPGRRGDAIRSASRTSGSMRRAQSPSRRSGATS